MAAGVKADGDYSVVMGALDVRDLSCSGTRVASTRHSRAATYVLQLMPMHFSWTEIRHWVFLSERHVDVFFGESKMHWHIS